MLTFWTQWRFIPSKRRYQLYSTIKLVRYYPNSHMGAKWRWQKCGEYGGVHGMAGGVDASCPGGRQGNEKRLIPSAADGVIGARIRRLHTAVYMAACSTIFIHAARQLKIGRRG